MHPSGRRLGVLTKRSRLLVLETRGLSRAEQFYGVRCREAPLKAAFSPGGVVGRWEWVGEWMGKWVGKLVEECICGGGGVLGLCVHVCVCAGWLLLCVCPGVCVGQLRHTCPCSTTARLPM